MKHIACRRWFTDLMFLLCWVCALFAFACAFIPNAKSVGIAFCVATAFVFGLGLWGRSIRRDIRVRRNIIRIPSQ